MTKKFLSLLTVVLLVAAGLAYWRFWQPSGNHHNQLRLMGHIEATETDLSFKVPGIITAINFQEGEYVGAGAVVATLDGQDLRDEVSAATARLKAAEATLKRLVTGSRQQEISEAQAAVLQAEADLENKKLEYQRMVGLLERRAVAVARRDNARAAFLMAQEALRRTQENFSLVKEGPRQEDIAKARAEVKQMQASLELAQTRLGYATLTAPVNGIVLTRPAEPGEVAAVGATILTTADLNNVYVQVYLAQTDLAKVRYGQKAVVTTDSFPDKKYAGWVSFINSKAEFTPKTVETYKERVALVYRTKIRVENPNHELKPGMPAEVVVFLEQDHTGNHHPR